MQRHLVVRTILTRIMPAMVVFLVMVPVLVWISRLLTLEIEAVRLQQPVTLREQQETDVVYEVIRDSVEESLSTLKAADRTEVSAQIQARIQRILVTIGDTVAADDVLIELNREDLDFRLKQAQQASMSADARLALAKADLNREQQPGDRADDVQASLKIAKSRHNMALVQAAAARDAVKSARVATTYAVVRAPHAGRIVDLLAEPGNMVQPGQLLLIVYDADSLWLEAAVMESLAVKLKPGQQLTARIDAIDREVVATIDKIVRQSHAPSRSFLVTTIVPGTDDLSPGMFGRLRIPVGERRHLCLNATAIQEIGKLQFVHVVRPDKRVERRLIRTRQFDIPGHVEVLSGLSAGERVILHDSKPR